jgi:hypothetical protein
MKKYVYIYSSTLEIQAAYYSNTKIKLLPYLVKNVLRDISRIDVNLYTTYRNTNFTSFDDEGLTKIQAVISNASHNKMFHLVQEVDVDETCLPYFTGEPLARPARRQARPANSRIDFFTAVNHVQEAPPAEAGYEIFDEEDDDA